ncbi:MAG TPA: flagellar hook-associated protein FlgL [Planctomycetota bacterium]|nr:flagellar hook-associated protein FlgL [Planctomycetota bacterium]
MIRPTQASTFAQVQRGLFANLARMVRAQEQVGSGKRINRPSDDPVGASQVLSLRRQISGDERYRSAVQSGRTSLDASSGALQDAAGLVSEARALLLQGMNGTQSAEDRRVIAGEIRLIRGQLLDIANSRLGDRYLFAGTATGVAPFASSKAGGRLSVVYTGNGDSQELLVGLGVSVPVNLPGKAIFAAEQRSGTQYAGLTGAAPGKSADQGTGRDYLLVRHDATNAPPALAAAGVGLVQGGALDTILGAHVVSVDAAAGTVQLDGGVAVAIPPAGDPAALDVTLTSDGGSVLHLDFSAWNGSGLSATVDGAGSISIDGASWTTLDFAADDLELIDSVTGSVTHVDTRGIHRAGSELVTYGGSVNLFDALEGMADDLENLDGLDAAGLSARLDTWLVELDRNQQNVLVATGTLGARSARLTSLEQRIQDASLQLSSVLSSVEDADISQVVLELTRSEQNLQLAQASSLRLLQNTLLNFLR